MDLFESTAVQNPAQRFAITLDHQVCMSLYTSIQDCLMKHLLMKNTEHAQTLSFASKQLFMEMLTDFFVIYDQDFTSIDQWALKAKMSLFFVDFAAIDQQGFYEPKTYLRPTTESMQWNLLTHSLNLIYVFFVPYLLNHSVVQTLFALKPELMCLDGGSYPTFILKVYHGRPADAWKNIPH